MPELIDRLKGALADRYHVERELGHGGMALVYLARDLKHDRRVAIKVLRPELAAALGPERFLREITLTAQLNHPHILPLLDSGEADGFLYYVMPYVEGESLRDRLNREKQLPIEDAVQIARGVADALDYAHRHAVVHRDIKPENILLEERHAVVADFGIARAINVAGGTRLTDTGLAVGTPEYMSPEQTSGGRELDGRCDIYALGCVLYEMLAGRPPFPGATVESVLHQHLTAPPPSVISARSTVPAPIDSAVRRALSKSPADRFGRANQFGDAIEFKAAVESAPAARTAVRLWAIVATVALAAVGLGSWRALRGRAATGLNPNLVAVIPFRVSADAPGLQYLREGMVDLLAAKLGGESGPVVADPSTVISRWRRAVSDTLGYLTEDDAYRLAADIGAGQVMLGSVVGSMDGLVISATLRRVSDGRPRGPVTVEGPSDSLVQLVDRLAIQMLALAGGESEHRVASFAGTPPAAVRQYLEGQRLVRQRMFREAMQAFGTAIDLDSTFAVAGIGYGTAGANLQVIGGEGFTLAWNNRHRLSRRDQDLLVARLGPAYPRPASRAELLAAAQGLVARAPDRPEAWQQMGERLFHDGLGLGEERSFSRAAEAFNEALRLDPGYGLAEVHLIEVAALLHDTATLRKLASQWYDSVRVDGGTFNNTWMIATALGDTAQLARLRTSMNHSADGPFYTPGAFTSFALFSGAGLDDLDTLALEARRWRTQAQRRSAALFFGGYSLNRGRPQAALNATLDLAHAEGIPGEHYRILVWDALFGDGDTVAAGDAVARIAPALDADALPADSTERDRLLFDWCLVGLWDATRGRLSEAAAHGARMRAELTRATLPPPVPSLCSAMLEAVVSQARRSATAARAIASLDSISRVIPPLGPFPFNARLYGGLNLVLARLHESRGDVAAALAAVRRKIYGSAAQGNDYYSSLSREEGRLAALTGDRDGAIRAYQHYLALRSNPEPALIAEVEGVRAELARLVGDRAR